MYKNYRKFSVRFLNFDPDLGEIIDNDKESKDAEVKEPILEDSKKEEEDKVVKPPKKKLKGGPSSVEDDKSGFKMPETKWSDDIKANLL